MERTIKKLLNLWMGLAAVYSVMKVVAKRRAEPEKIDDDNPYIHVSGCIHHVVGKESSTYQKTVKPVLDQIISFGSLIILSPLLGVISLAIYIDDPGPVFFTQKRIGKDKSFFYCHKFRSMRMGTPHDVPTHQLFDPDRYITRVGKFLRRTSMDELPQVWDIFRSKMSVVGPRPALWNQDDLVRERDKYGANNVMPGLTGLAQISGRDELEIAEKARIDGEYVEKQGFFMDVACFIRTIASVLGQDGIVEGGTVGEGEIVSPNRNG